MHDSSYIDYVVSDYHRKLVGSSSILDLSALSRRQVTGGAGGDGRGGRGYSALADNVTSFDIVIGHRRDELSAFSMLLPCWSASDYR